jgi:hypothetical protein
VLTYKAEHLADSQPLCRLERVAIDLNQSDQMERLLHRIAVEYGSALIVTEGVLTYLGEDGVARLARQLYARDNIECWLTDLVSAEAMILMRRLLDVPDQAGVRLTFAPCDGPGFFAQFGWRPVAYASCFDAGRSLRRWLFSEWFVSQLSSPQRQVLNSVLGIVTFVRDP